MSTMARKWTGLFGAAVAVFGLAVAGNAAQYGKQASDGVTRGDKAPDFTLKDTAGNEHTLSDYTKGDRVVVIEWFNPDCPFVKKFHRGKDVLPKLATEWAERDVVWLAVNSGAPGKQGAGLERNKKAVEDYKLNYPVLMDDTGVVGRSFGAKRTPEMFIIDEQGTIIYHGPIDNSSRASTIGDTNYIDTALTQHFNGETIVEPSIPVYGCSVKY